MPSTVRACLYPGAVQVWRSLDEVGLDDAPGPVVTVGNFDGVHLGHQHLLAGVVARARALGAAVGGDDLRPAPDDGDPPRLRAAAADHPRAPARRCSSSARSTPCWCCPFTRELSLWEPDEFVRRVLVERAARRRGARRRELPLRPPRGRRRHDAARGRASGTASPSSRCRSPATRTRWSSTYVRQCLAEGDVASAAAALGRPHRVEGPVVEGDKRGRELGYPTANLDLPHDAAVPDDGVYAGWLTRADGTRLPAAISIGTNPTFGGTTRRVEAYVLDRDDLELYGEHVAVDFLARLRETITFDGVEPLLVQMADDVDQARALTAALVSRPVTVASTSGPPGRPRTGSSGTACRSSSRAARSRSTTWPTAGRWSCWASSTSARWSSPSRRTGPGRSGCCSRPAGWWPWWPCGRWPTWPAASGRSSALAGSVSSRWRSSRSGRPPSWPCCARTPA